MASLWKTFLGMAIRANYGSNAVPSTPADRIHETQQSTAQVSIEYLSGNGNWNQSMMVAPIANIIENAMDDVQRRHPGSQVRAVGPEGQLVSWR